MYILIETIADLRKTGFRKKMLNKKMLLFMIVNISKIT